MTRMDFEAVNARSVTVRTFTVKTALGVNIAKVCPFTKRRAAIEWAEKHAGMFPGLKVVMQTARGPRTIWRDSALTKAAAWHEARKRGQRLAEHLLPEDIDTALYTQRMETLP